MDTTHEVFSVEELTEDATFNNEENSTPILTSARALLTVDDFRCIKISLRMRISFVFKQYRYMKDELF